MGSHVFCGVSGNMREEKEMGRSIARPGAGTPKSSTIMGPGLPRRKEYAFVGNCHDMTWLYDSATSILNFLANALLNDGMGE